MQQHVKKLSMFLLVCLIFAQASACSAGEIEDILSNQLHEGITINALAIDPITPSTLYAGTNFGVFKSMDGGEHWSQVNTGLTVMKIYALVVNPQKPTTLYAGTDGGIVFTSSDGAGSWRAISTGLETNFVHSLAIDPITPATLYAGTSPYPGGPLYKSTNAGDTWSLAGKGLESLTVHSLAIDPLTPTTLYAGTSSAVFKSTDGGLNWIRIHIGSGVAITALVIDQETPANLYAAGLGGHIYWTNDAGETWNASTSNQYIYTLAVNQESSSIIYAGTQGYLGGVLKSTDGGANWASVNTDLPETDVFALAIEPVRPATLYAGTHYHGVFKSMDGGRSWRAINSGLTATSEKSP